MLITTSLLWSTSVASAAEIIPGRSPWDAPTVSSLPLGLPFPTPVEGGVFVPRETELEFASRLRLLDAFPGVCQKQIDGAVRIVEARPPPPQPSIWPVVLGVFIGGVAFGMLAR